MFDSLPLLLKLLIVLILFELGICLGIWIGWEIRDLKTKGTDK